MSRSRAHFIALAATVAAAVAMSGGALAADIPTVETPFDVFSPGLAAGTGPSHLGDSSADALKRDYLVCERAVTNAPPDPAMPAVCAALYEELRVRVFGGNLDALLDWFRAAWHAGIKAR